MSVREDLHTLVDRLPEDRAGLLWSGLHALVDGLDEWRAEYLLRGLRDGDALLVSLALAPYDDEPTDPQEEAAVAEARKEVEAGEARPWTEVRNRYLRP